MGERVRYGEAPHTEGDGYQAVVNAIDGLRDDINQRHTENRSDVEVLQTEMRVAIARIDDIARGFPDNDPDGHRRAHEAIILKANERAALYRALREELVKKGLWALLVVLGIALWQYIKGKLTT